MDDDQQGLDRWSETEFRAIVAAGDDAQAGTQLATLA